MFSHYLLVHLKKFAEDMPIKCADDKQSQLAP